MLSTGQVPDPQRPVIVAGDDGPEVRQHAKTRHFSVDRFLEYKRALKRHRVPGTQGVVL
jgi:hypothetical protein